MNRRSGAKKKDWAASGSDRRTAAPRLPGDPDRAALVARMIRVDHAGEYGARRIYEGQMAVLGRQAGGGSIREMHAQELRHLEHFEKLLVARRIRPTALQPLWHLAGFALGAAGALLGESAAMACTVAVEEVIDAHYAGQIAALGEEETELRQSLEAFRRDELAHRDIGLERGAREAPGHGVLSAAVKAGSRMAIWLSERL